MFTAEVEYDLDGELGLWPIQFISCVGEAQVLFEKHKHLFAPGAQFITARLSNSAHV